ncbi:hypothetical protein [Roseibium sp. RKSG952]|uniref:hypothetical protein n=1 Tax=Roseibium sp. RKSG952 TaxID=2529384 RepID=UPI0012BD6EFA|nr:hypothetical protein [Roseibium sp. RKSG952]MTH96253.1 hypothetical protein [Roseibium sp. RKSG952]
MSKAIKRDIEDALSDELERDSLKRMIYFTKREAEKDGRAFCAYFLQMALSCLDEETDEMNEIVRAKITRIPVQADSKTTPAA